MVTRRAKWRPWLRRWLERSSLFPNTMETLNSVFIFEENSLPLQISSKISLAFQDLLTMRISSRIQSTSIELGRSSWRFDLSPTRRHGRWRQKNFYSSDGKKVWSFSLPSSAYFSNSTAGNDLWTIIILLFFCKKFALFFLLKNFVRRVRGTFGTKNTWASET